MDEELGSLFLGCSLVFLLGSHTGTKLFVQAALPKSGAGQY